MSRFLRPLFFFGRPFGPLYSKVMRLRARCYATGGFTSHRLPVPVVSVGNLTLGGTGKTPTVRLLADFFVQKGYHPAIISRGYGGQAGEAVNVVSDGHDLLLSPRDAGDEPYMLASSLPGVPVLTGRKRILPCQYACNQLGSDLLLLDDGFQHLQVQRNLDLVLFNATSLLGNGRVFPGGELREPLNALARAHLFLITGLTDLNMDQVNKFKTLLAVEFPQTPVYTSVHSASGILDGSGRETTPPTDHTPLHAFCGIGHPERFFSLLAQQGIVISGKETFTDHMQYSAGQFAALERRALDHGAKALITTEKDWVKLRVIPRTLPLYVLPLTAVPEAGFLETVLRSVKACSGY